jgi:hypothetical protein
MDWMWIAIAVVGAAYFIGEGLKNFNNPGGKSLLESLDEDDSHELLKESEIHYFMGIDKEDAKVLLRDHPEVPHIIINGKTYYPKHKLRQWLLKIGE